MAVSRALHRLLRIRELEEDQCRQALEAAVGELRRLEQALAATADRKRRGRSLVHAGVQTNQLPDRLAGFEEARAADRLVALLNPRIEAMEAEVTARREAFLVKRVERRQAETLIEETQAREAIDAARRGQQSLDDWYSGRRYREGLGEELRQGRRDAGREGPWAANPAGLVRAATDTLAVRPAQNPIESFQEKAKLASTEDEET